MPNTAYIQKGTYNTLLTSVGRVRIGDTYFVDGCFKVQKQFSLWTGMMFINPVYMSIFCTGQDTIIARLEFQGLLNNVLVYRTYIFQMFHYVSLDGFSLELLIFHGVFFDGFSIELLMFHDVFFRWLFN